MPAVCWLCDPHVCVCTNVPMSGDLTAASVSCQVPSSLPSKVKYFAGLNSSQFGIWERGRERVTLTPVRPPAFSSLTAVNGAAEAAAAWLDRYLAAAVTPRQRDVLCSSVSQCTGLS